MDILSNLSVAWPSILMGAVIPCVVLIALLCTNKRKQTSFVPVLYGFGTFFVTLVAVAVLMLVLSQIFLPSIAISSEADADIYIYVGGAIILLLFFFCSEALKMISYQTVLKGEKKEFAGLTFGSGFILAQNLLILGLIYAGEVDLSQALTFGLLMLISGVIYLLISAIGYQLHAEGQRYAGAAVGISYYLMFAAMLIFSNIYVTYSFVTAVLIFNLVIAYFVLPLPFKKKGEDAA